MSPSIAKDATIIARYRYFPSWFYGYYGHNIEFRQTGPNQVQARGSYRYRSTNSRSSKHTTAWAPMFSPGDSMTLEGTVKGAGMDIEIEGGLLITPGG